MVMSFFVAFALLLYLFLKGSDRYTLNHGLQSGSHFLWIALGLLIIVGILMWRYSIRLDRNITNLRTFADRAAMGDTMEIEELASFPNDDLGQIAERIITMYRQLETTRSEQDRLKRELTQNIAHELKTPVASISGYIETLLNHDELPFAMRQQFLERCMAQSQRLTHLLADISTLHRLDDKALPPQRETIDVAQLVHEIEQETALQFEQRRMQLGIHLPAGCVVEGDRSQIYSLFRNLIDNALAYAGEGATVSVRGEQGSGQWQFAVSDSGPGVPALHLPRLFERFYRVEKGRSRELGGTGLGLAIVKNVVLLHGGTIHADRAPEGGLRVAFTLKAVAL